jgi:hypothetical protein
MRARPKNRIRKFNVSNGGGRSCHRRRTVVRKLQKKDILRMRQD